MHGKLCLILEGLSLTIESTGRPQANEPSWHEPRRTRWSRRPSWSWWPIRRLRRSSHARRLWWPPWWLPTQRRRLPWRLPWRSWCPRRLQPLLSNDQRERKSTQCARFEAVACSQYAVSLHTRQRFRRQADSGRGALKWVLREKGYETRRSACFHDYHSCVCYSFLRDEKDKNGNGTGVPERSHKKLLPCQRWSKSHPVKE
jgi:hypothetical protein